MQDFLVLGIVPGTNFVISFTMWLDAMLLIASLFALCALYRRRDIVAFYIAIGRVAWTIHSHQLA